jgi:HEAT repeat protein
VKKSKRREKKREMIKDWARSLSFYSENRKRLAIAQNLWKCSDTKRSMNHLLLVDALIRGLDDNDERVGWTCAWALKDMGASVKKDLDQVVEFSYSDRARTRARFALKYLGQQNSAYRAMKNRMMQTTGVDVNLADVQCMVGRLRSSEAVREKALEDIASNCDIAMYQLIDALRYNDPVIVGTVIDALSAIGGEKVYNAIIRALQDPDVNMRMCAARTIGCMRRRGTINDDAVRLLGKALDDELGVCREAAISLRYFDTHESKIYLVRVVENYRPGWWEAMKSLEYMGYQWDLAALVRLLKYKDADKLAYVLGKIMERSPRVLDGDDARRFIEILGVNHERVRNPCKKILVGMGDAVLDEVSAYLNTGSNKVRVPLVEVLGEMDGEKPMRLLVDALDNSSVEARKAALLALKGMGDRPLDELNRYVKKKALTPAVVELLGGMDDPRAGAVLRLWMGDDAQKKLKVISGLPSAKGKVAHELLSQALSDESASIRREAIERIRKNADGTMIEPLLKIVCNDTDESTMSLALKALYSIDDERVKPILIRITQLHPSHDIRREAHYMLYPSNPEREKRSGLGRFPIP